MQLYGSFSKLPEMSPNTPNGYSSIKTCSRVSVCRISAPLCRTMREDGLIQRIMIFGQKRYLWPHNNFSTRKWRFLHNASSFWAKNRYTNSLRCVQLKHIEIFLWASTFLKITQFCWFAHRIACASLTWSRVHRNKSAWIDVYKHASCLIDSGP